MMAKAVKNAHEQEMLRAAHVRAVSVPTVPCRIGGRAEEAGCSRRPALSLRTPRSATRWPSSSTCSGWRGQSRRGRWTSFRGLSASMHFAGQCCPPGLPCPGKGNREPSAPSFLPAAFQGPGAQPWAQLRVHLSQRAQRSAGSLQVGLEQRWAVGRGRWALGRGQWAMGSWERALTPLPRSPSNRSSRTLSAREMYLFDTGGQYLYVALNRDPPPQPTSRAPQSQRGGCISPIHDAPLQGWDNRHHSHSALGRAHPSPEGTSPSHISQHPPALPRATLKCPAYPHTAQHSLWHSASRSWPGLDVQGWVSGYHHTHPLPCPTGSLHPCADGQH